MPGTRKLGKDSAQRKAMLRQQVTDLLDLGRMETTVTRAKEIAPMAEKMITLGKPYHPHGRPSRRCRGDRCHRARIKAAA